MTRQEFILIAGGEVDRSKLPPSVNKNDYKIFSNWLDVLQGFVNGYTSETGLQVTLHFILSPSLACRTKPLEDGSVAILLPLGMLVRVRILARILLRYFKKNSEIRFANSLMDDIPESDWGIAPDLNPVFGEIADESSHWQLLENLNAKTKLDKDIEPAVNDLLWVAFCYLTFHELAHAVRGHFSIVDGLRRDSKALQQIGGDGDLRKALEIDADSIATSLMLMLSLKQMDIEGRSAEMSSAFFWIGYTFTLVLGLYDSRRKALSLYSKGIYPHPIVRHSLIMDFIDGSISQNPPTWKETMTDSKVSGWNKCVDALRQLDVEVFKGKFGTNSKNTKQLVTFIPVTAMNYTIFDQTFIADDVREARALTHKVLSKIGLANTTSK